ncbi:MAG: YceI family protein [Alphaproteobacteria bacterium]
MKYLLAFFLLFASPAIAAEYTIDKENSAITFSGEHAGNEFNGAFEEWDASIIFDAQDLESSNITATFNTASAKTGDKLYDGTLPQGSWFDVKNYPHATFETTSITVNEDGSYKANATLTIRDIMRPLSFDFTLEEGETTHAKAAFAIDRLDYDIGKGADDDGTWVSLAIGITLNIVASKQ